MTKSAFSLLRLFGCRIEIQHKAHVKISRRERNIRAELNEELGPQHGLSGLAEESRPNRHFLLWL